MPCNQPYCKFFTGRFYFICPQREYNNIAKLKTPKAKLSKRKREQHMMETSPLTVIDINEQVKHTKQGYFNMALSLVNDHVIRVSVMTQPFYWHIHPNSDETFLAIEGSILIEVEEKTVELLPGQLFTIPRNVKHRTGPTGGRSVNLTIEQRDMETVRMDD